MAMVASWHQGWQADRNLPLRARRPLMQRQALARGYAQNPSAARPQLYIPSIVRWLLPPGACAEVAAKLQASLVCRHLLPSRSWHSGWELV